MSLSIIVVGRKTWRLIFHFSWNWRRILKYVKFFSWVATKRFWATTTSPWPRFWTKARTSTRCRGTSRPPWSCSESRTISRPTPKFKISCLSLFAIHCEENLWKSLTVYLSTPQLKAFIKNHPYSWLVNCRSQSKQGFKLRGRRAFGFFFKIFYCSTAIWVITVTVSLKFVCELELRAPRIYRKIEVMEFLQAVARFLRCWILLTNIVLYSKKPKRATSVANSSSLKRTWFRAKLYIEELANFSQGHRTSWSNSIKIFQPSFTFW